MVLKQATGAPEVMEEAPECRHHWVIEPAKGGFSHGECQKCREVRAFENSIRDPGEAENE